MNGEDQKALLFSVDQSGAFSQITALLKNAGIDLFNSKVSAKPRNKKSLIALIGKAGSGKTLILCRLFNSLMELGVQLDQGDYERRFGTKKRKVTILAPTNKAAGVLRTRGIPATTLHRVLYTPIYDENYKKIFEWLLGEANKPSVEGISEQVLDKAKVFFQKNKSIPGALATAGLRGSDFITGWKRRDRPLDIAFVDEASMIDDGQFEDLKEIFSTLIMFGDPSQLAPVNQSGGMVFDKLGKNQLVCLRKVHRQAYDNPIISLANDLNDASLKYRDFEDMIKEWAKKDDRIVWSQRVEADLMSRSPVLVWRNETRVRLIHAFRSAYRAPEKDLLPGEPLVCDGVELPLKYRKKRIDLEMRGLTKGAQVIYLGVGRKFGFSRLFVMGMEEPEVSAASIVKIERPEEEPFIPSAANLGAVFLHGAATTVHKSQGSQWTDVQIFAPDIWAASRTDYVEAGIPLWKRLAYVAITRAQERLFWVVKNKISKPTKELWSCDS